jgi:hypothetical protein
MKVGGPSRINAKKPIVLLYRYLDLFQRGTTQNDDICVFVIEYKA